MEYGVDVHARYQAGLNVDLLAQQGYSLFATKLSQGTAIPSVSGFSAAQFKARALSWLDQARAAGMIPAAYHWLNSQPGAEQAKFFYSLVREAGGPDNMLIQLDNEDDATWQVTKDWAAEWEQLTGGHPWLMYTGGWWWRPRGWPGATLTPYLWDSHYLSADADTIADDPAVFAARIPSDWWRPGYGGWANATILQFSSRGDAGSLGNNVDLNATRLTRQQLLDNLGAAVSASDLLNEDVIPNRQWRPDFTTNPKVRWEYAIVATWDLAYGAATNAGAALVKAEEALAALARIEAMLTTAATPAVAVVEEALRRVVNQTKLMT